MAQPSKAAKDTGKEQGKEQESHTGEDHIDLSTDTVDACTTGVLCNSPNRGQKNPKRKTEASKHIGRCQELKRPKLADSASRNSIKCDKLKVRQVKFRVISKSISKTSAEESTSSESPACIDPEGLVIDPEALVIDPEGAVVNSEGTPVNLESVYDSKSTEGVLKAVKNKGSHTLSLDGNNITCRDTRFTEYSYVLRYPNGAPKETLYFYECCEYPGYYIRWYCEQSAVNCEPHKSDEPHPFEPQWEEFRWHRETAADIKSDLSYSRLVAGMPNPPNVLSPYYLTFEDGQPAIHQSFDNAMIFLITPANTSSSSTK